MNGLTSRRFRWLALLGLALQISITRGQETLPNDAITALQKKCVDAVRHAEKSVVAIARVSKDDGSAGFQVPNLRRLGWNSRLQESLPTDPDFVPTDFGAGVVIDPSGLIVTTYHVLGNAKQSDYVVWTQHKPYKAAIVAADGWFDLAVLKIDTKDLVPLPLGDAKPVKKGEFVIAIGNPQAIARDGEVSATWGLVANLKRRAPQVPERETAVTGRETLHHYGTLIQVDRRLHVGYSGGALLDLEGRMIGLLTGYAGSPTAEESASFAIPVDDHFQRALQQMKAGKAPEFGFLGIGLQPLDARLRRLGAHGAIVESVMPGTPAARAELKVGDLVTHFNGEPLYDDDDLIREVSQLSADQTVKIKILRGPDLPAKGEQLEISAVLTKRGNQTLRPGIATVSAPNWRGMQVDDATAAPRNALLSIQLPTTGALYITEVTPESPAWKANLRAGSFITAIAEQPVTTAKQFFTVVAGQSGDISLRILAANGETRMQTVSP